MKKIKSTLPLLTCLIHAQMRPPYVLSSKEKKGIFPKLKVKMEQLLRNASLDEINQWYMENLPIFTRIQITEEEDEVNPLVNVILNLQENEYTPTIAPDCIPIMKINVEVNNNFSDLFYDVALQLESKRTYLWLIAMEHELHNDEDMLQLVRKILSLLNEFSKECVKRQVQSPDTSNEIIKLRIMQLYFAIEKTFCKRQEWRSYLEEIAKLPLTLDEYCYMLWEGCPEIGWREAYGAVITENIIEETQNLPQLTERPKLTTAAEKFVNQVAPFCFEELDLVKALNPQQQAELIETMVKDACYAAAMLKYLGYYDRLRGTYQMNSNEGIIKHCAKAIGCAISTYRKYFYSMKADDPYNIYARHNSQAFFDNGQIETDYNRIKESK